MRNSTCRRPHGDVGPSGAPGDPPTAQSVSRRRSRNRFRTASGRCWTLWQPGSSGSDSMTNEEQGTSTSQDVRSSARRRRAKREHERQGRKADRQAQHCRRSPGVSHSRGIRQGRSGVAQDRSMTCSGGEVAPRPIRPLHSDPEVCDVGWCKVGGRREGQHPAALRGRLAYHAGVRVRPRRGRPASVDGSRSSSPFRARRQAKDKLTDLVSTRNRGEFIEPDKRSLGAWLDEWVDLAIKPPRRTSEPTTPTARSSRSI